jgi:hypothetical protein
MGFFSFKTQDTNRSISNVNSIRGAFTVTMSDNNGNRYTEANYHGYGVFGGKDFYELLAEMNGKQTREEGIKIAFSGEKYVSPNLSEALDWKWIDSAPETCEDQGYFYSDIESPLKDLLRAAFPECVDILCAGVDNWNEGQDPKTFADVYELVHTSLAYYVSKVDGGAELMEGLESRIEALEDKINSILG